MAKTTNHPPYEIDPWKADTTEPPSGLTFNPEIVETAGKPKQAPVPAEPTEGQLKIEEAISRQDQFHNDMAALKKEQEAILEQVQENIDETNNKIKQLNELEEKIKKQVGEYTDDTDKYLREAELLKGKLKEAQGKMDKAVSDASSAISAAEKAQKALKAYQDGEAERLKEAINQAQIGVAKAADVNKQIESLKNSLGGEIDKQIAVNKTIKEIQSDNEALGSRLDDVLKTSKQGVDDAAKAVEMIANSVDVSTSAVPLIPGTTTPTWQHELVPVERGTHPEDKGLPEKITTYYRHKPEFIEGQTDGWTSSIGGVFKNVVSVDNRYEYKIGMWIRATQNNSKYTYITLSDDNDYRHIVRKAASTDTQTSRSNNTWGNPLRAIIYRPSTEWEYVESVFVFEDGVEFVKISDVSFQTYNSNDNHVQIFITGLRIAPLIPSQAEVDRAQNKAIEANSKAIEANSTALKQQEAVNKLNSDFRESQTKINKTYNAMWDAQGKRNLLQEGIDKSQNDAVIASARASLTPELGNSLVPYAAPSDQDILDGKAVWNMPHYALPKKAGWVMLVEKPANDKPTEVSNIGWSIGTTSGDGTMDYRGPDTPCVPGGIYNVEFWGYANESGSKIYIELRETGTGTHAVKEGTGDTSGGIYIVGGMEFKVGWHKYTGTIKIREDIRSVYINNWYWNHPRGSKSKIQLITGLKIDLAVPSVWDVVNANTLALENQKAINDKQKGIAAAHTKAIDSNRKAIRALAKIDLGGSLLAYMPLTDAEIEKGITREYVPAWAANATNVLDGSKLSGTTSNKGYIFMSGTGGSAKGEEVYAQVSQGTQYLLDIDLSTPTYMFLDIIFKTSNRKIENPVKKFYWAKEDKYGGLYTFFPRANTNKVTISTDGGRVRTLVEFQDNVEDIYIEKLEWTRTNSVTVKSFSLAPYTPSQSAIDARQEETLGKLKEFDTKQVEVNNKVDGAIDLIHRTAAGVMFMPRETVRASDPHGVAAKMPYRDRYLELYSNTSFRGNVTIVINYSNGNTQVLNEEFNHDYTTESASKYHRNVKAISDKDNRVKFKRVQLPLGDVNNIYLLMDPTEWKYV